MRIPEFCKTYNVSHQSVYRKIKNHSTELEGHISKDEHNVTDLDLFAVNFLKPQKESYKALDERNYYLFKKNKEIVSENERLQSAYGELVSKVSELSALNDFLKKSNEEYIASNAILKSSCESCKKKIADDKALSKIIEDEYENSKAKFLEEKAELNSQIELQAAEIARLSAEVEGLKNQLQSAEEQISEYAAKEADRENKNKPNNMFMHIFGQDKK
jgi:chromosome segregation ATPase